MKFCPGSVLRGTLMDLQAHRLRSRKRHEPYLRVRHHRTAELEPLPRAQVHHPIRQARLLQQAHKPRRNRRSIDRRLQNHRVPADDRRRRHPRHNRKRKVPWRNHRADAQRYVTKLVTFSGKLNRCRRSIEPQRLASIELQKVDRLAHIRIGLAPVLADLIGQPRAELELPLANQRRRPKQQPGALRDWNSLPTQKRSLSRLPRLLPRAQRQPADECLSPVRVALDSQKRSCPRYECACRPRSGRTLVPVRSGPTEAPLPSAAYFRRSRSQQMVHSQRA